MDAERAGAVAAAEDAPFAVQSTVAIGAGKAGIDRDALNLAAEHPLQFVREFVVAFGERHLQPVTGDEVFLSTRSFQHCSVESARRNSPAKRNLASGTGTLIKSLPRPIVNA